MNEMDEMQGEGYDQTTEAEEEGIVYTPRQ